MKTKKINSKIEALNSLILSIKSKAENAKYLKESGIFQTLETDLQSTLALQKEVQSAKNLLKTKKTELEEGVKKLKNQSREAGKILKKDKKPAKAKSAAMGKTVAGKTPAGKKKTVKPKAKPAKNKN